MKILVVGGAGYVGGVIVDLLLLKKNMMLLCMITFYMKKVIGKIVNL